MCFISSFGSVQMNVAWFSGDLVRDIKAEAQVRSRLLFVTWTKAQNERSSFHFLDQQFGVNELCVVLKRCGGGDQVGSTGGLSLLVLAHGTMWQSFFFLRSSKVTDAQD
jgi:hypothetical protein